MISFKKTRTILPWLFATAAALTAGAQSSMRGPESTASIQGAVRDAAGSFIPDATIRLVSKGSDVHREARSDAGGSFTIPGIQAGSYTLEASTATLHTSRAVGLTVSDQSTAQVILIIDRKTASPSGVEDGAKQPMQFSDNPDFAVAGVTDWTAVGGHGSDATLRTSEDLARQTAALKAAPPVGSGVLPTALPASEPGLLAAAKGAPQSFQANHQLGAYYLGLEKYDAAVPYLNAAYRVDPANVDNAYDLAVSYERQGKLAQAQDVLRQSMVHGNTAALHSLAGELDEKTGDPLSAVHEDEMAVHLDPSEENYYTWGSELLLHRAVWQAADVFRNGSKAYPKSARMLTALGTALFAGDLYDEAAARLCEASDLNPSNVEPYLFMGRIQMEAPAPLPCIEPKLANFVRLQPGNAEAHYLYAMVLLKKQQPSNVPQVQQLLQEAVALDPKCAEAYLETGILALNARNLQGAVDSFTKAIEANPNSGEAHYRLGVSYDRMGEAEKAKSEFKIHDEIERVQAEAVERQRRQVKQFLIVLQGENKSPAAQ